MARMKPSDRAILKQKNAMMDASRVRTAPTVQTVVLGAEKTNQKSLKDSVKTFDSTGKSV
jgi:hypothetical protein